MNEKQTWKVLEILACVKEEAILTPRVERVRIRVRFSKYYLSGSYESSFDRFRRT